MRRFPYSGWPDEAVDLVEGSIRTHGGWEAWKRLEVIRIEPRRFGGPLPLIKGLGRTFRAPRLVEIRPHRQIAVFEDYPDAETTGLFEAGTVSLVDAKTTETLIGSKGHGRTLERRSRLSRWSALDALYVLGHALLRDHSFPFTLGEAGFVSAGSRLVDGEALRTLELDLPRHGETGDGRQTIHFGPEGLVRRSDLGSNRAGARATCVQLWEDYDLVDGLKLPMRRRVKLGLSGRALPVVLLESVFGQVEIETGQ